MNWLAIKEQFDKGNKIPGITLETLMFYESVMQPCYRIREDIGQYHFDMLRLIGSKRKITYTNDLGIVGLSACDFNDNHCYLTEGVSDMMAGYLYMREDESPLRKSNILGLTNLSGNQVARALLKSLFSNYTIIGDNDVTGQTNASKFRSLLQSLGKNVRLYKVKAGCKDLSDEYVKHLIFSGKFKPSNNL